MCSWARSVLVLLLLVAGASPAAAQDEATSRARAHFEIGQGLFRLGNYSDALKEFSAGYELVPKARFLLNIAHCYWKLGRQREARGMYQRFLAEAAGSESAEQIDLARRQIAEIDAQLAAHEATAAHAAGAPPRAAAADAPSAGLPSAAGSPRSAAGSPRSAAPPPASESGVASAAPAPPSESGVASAAPAAPASAEARRRRVRLAWIGGTLGVVAVGIGLGVGLGVGLGRDAFHPTLPDVGPGTRAGLLGVP